MNKDKHNNQSKEYYHRKNKHFIKHYGLSLATIRRYGFGLASSVYEKYHRRCSECGSTEHLTIHHIDGSGRHDEPNDLINNLQLICRKCHGSLHGKKYWSVHKKRYDEKSTREYRKLYMREYRKNMTQEKKEYYKKYYRNYQKRKCRSTNGIK